MEGPICIFFYDLVTGKRIRNGPKVNVRHGACCDVMPTATMTQYSGMPGKLITCNRPDIPPNTCAATTAERMRCEGIIENITQKESAGPRAQAYHTPHTVKIFPPAPFISSLAPFLLFPSTSPRCRWRCHQPH